MSEPGPAQPNSQNVSDEEQRLGGNPPLQTIGILLIGPLISQIASSFYGVGDSAWVAKALGNEGLSSLSIFSSIDQLGHSFGYLMNRIASVTISGRIGRKQHEEAGQIICDLIRCSLLCGIPIPAIFLPTAKPIGRWLGADEETVKMGFYYLIPNLAFSFIATLFMLMCGCLEAEGRSGLIALCHAAAFILAVAILDPIFLLVFKWGLVSSSIAQVVAQAIPTIIIIICYFAGKFDIKPKLSGLLKPFSPGTFPAMKIGTLMGLGSFFHGLTSLFFRKFITMVIENNDDLNFTTIFAAYGAVTKIWTVKSNIETAVTMAILPAASYAFTSKRVQRFFALYTLGIGIVLIWGCLWLVLMLFLSRDFAKLISEDSDYLNWSEKMLKAYFIESPFGWGQVMSITLIQSVQTLPKAAIYNLIVYGIGGMLGMTLIYFTGKTDIVRMMYISSLRAAFALVLGVVLCTKPILGLFDHVVLLENNSNRANTEQEVEHATTEL